MAATAQSLIPQIGPSIVNRFALRPSRGLCRLASVLVLLQTCVPAGVSLADDLAGISGGQVVAGQATIGQVGSTLNVNTMTDRTIINWNGFSIGANETANFIQPGANSAVLNRVTTPNNPSAIFGAMNSNGNVTLVNPSGIVVGSSGVINTNGFTASVLDIPNNEFLQGGILHFRGDSTASVINDGTIHTKTGGAALIGGSVINNGTITSEGGSISLASGGSVTLSDGSQFTHADMATIESGISPTAGLIKNSGTVRATGAMEVGGEVFLVNPGGKIMNDGTIAAYRQSSDGTSGGLVHVEAADKATIDGEINVDGSANGNGGDVSIWSDVATEFKGSISARGGESGGDGGTVEVSGQDLALGGTIDVAAPNGSAGTVTLDPAILNIDAAAANTIVSSLAGGGTVNVEADNEINVNAAIDSSAQIGTATLNFQDESGSDVVITLNENITLGALQNLVFDGAVILGADAILTANDVTFQSTVDGSHSLTVYSDSGAISFANDVTITSNGALSLNANLLNLDGDLDVANGLSGTIAQTNILGSVGGAEIQDAIDVSAENAIVNVAAGSYSSFIADVQGITINGVGSSTIINASSPAVTIAANGVTAQNMSLLGTGAAGDVGVLLDGNAAVNLSDAQILNINFSTLETGIKSQGNVASATISGADMSSIAQDGISFSGLDSSQIVISNSSIDADRHGILFDGVISDPTTQIDIANNTLIQGANQGIVFARNVNDASILIRGNGSDSTNGIRGQFDSIAVNGGSLNNANFMVGGLAPGEGNFISSSSQALDIDAINGGSFSVVNNALIQGATGIEFEQAISNAAIVVANNTQINSSGAGIQFRDDITNSSIAIGGNAISASANGIVFLANKQITDSAVSIGSGATSIAGSPVLLAGNLITAGSGGINVRSKLAGTSDFTIDANFIGTQSSPVGGDGIAFRGSITDNSRVSIGGSNQVFASGHAIELDDVQSANPVTIFSGTFNGIAGALRVNNSGAAGGSGQLVLSGGQFIGGAGSNVVEVITDSGNAGIDVEFASNARIEGGQNGLVLSGPETNVFNDTLGNIELANLSGDFIQLADGTEFQPGAPTIIDARDVLFDGVAGRDLDISQWMPTEDRLLHHPDDSSLGLININDLFVVNGESIQTAVNAAGALAGPQTVLVAPGTFGGSVEVWVDDLTLLGSGNTTIIDTDAVDPFANNGDRNNGFEVFARSATAAFLGDVNGVTIDGFRFDTLSSNRSNTGVVLGQNFFGLRSASDTTIQNSRFNDLSNGVVAHDISGTTAFSNLRMRRIWNRGIDILPIIAVDDSIVVDSSDIISRRDAVRFDSPILGSNIRIQGNRLASQTGDAIQFNRFITGSNILIGGTNPNSSNRLAAAERGIDFHSDILLSDLQVVGNESISGGEQAIRLNGEVNLSRVSIIGNADLIGGKNAIQARDDISLSRLDVSGNGRIIGQDDDAILIEGALLNSMVNIGATLIDLGNGFEIIGGNDRIVGGDDGINVDSITQSLFTVTDNNVVRGQSGSGIEFEGTVDQSLVAVAANQTIRGDEEGIEFDTDIRDSAIVISANETIRGNQSAGIQFKEAIESSLITVGGPLPILGNQRIRGGSDGIEFQDQIVDSQIRIEGNDSIVGLGSSGDAIVFQSAADIDGPDSLISISNNLVLRGGSRGIVVRGDINDATLNIRNNRVRGLNSDAILLNGELVNATVNIGGPLSSDGNVLIGGGDGVDLDDITDSNVTISNNSINADSDGIEFDGSISGNSQIQVSDNRITASNGINQLFTSSVNDDAMLEIIDNEINLQNTNAGTGINLNHLNSSQAVVVQGGSITGGAQGVAVLQSTGDQGQIVIDALTVNQASEAGLIFRSTSPGTSETLEVTLLNEVTINGGTGPNEVGMVFDGEGLSLTDDSLGDTRFVDNTGNFIELRNGGLFEPGRPTLIDGTGVHWDGLHPEITSQRQQIIDRIVDFLDDPTLGLIFPGAGFADDQTYDRFTRYQDYFRTWSALMGPYPAGWIHYRTPTITVAESLDDQGSNEAE